MLAVYPITLEILGKLQIPTGVPLSLCLQATVTLLETLLAARDVEVTELTAKLRSFASETQKLLHELEQANGKMAKMAQQVRIRRGIHSPSCCTTNRLPLQYDELETEVEDADEKLDTLTQKNLGLLGQISELQVGTGFAA
jgi:DNA repair exonuclease SbcCD ATPase subunit